jgi:hypothetical protein
MKLYDVETNEDIEVLTSDGGRITGVYCKGKFECELRDASFIFQNNAMTIMGYIPMGNRTYQMRSFELRTYKLSKRKRKK